MNLQALRENWDTFTKQAPGEWAKVREHAEQNWLRLAFAVSVCGLAYFLKGQMAMICAASACIIFYQIYGQTVKIFGYFELKAIVLPVLSIVLGLSRGSLEGYMIAYMGFLFLGHELQRGREVTAENMRLEGLLSTANDQNEKQKETIVGFNAFFEKWNTQVQEFYKNNTQMLELWGNLKGKAAELKTANDSQTDVFAKTLEFLQKTEKEIKQDVAGKISEMTKDLREIITKKAQLLQEIEEIKKTLNPLVEQEKKVIDKLDKAVAKLGPAIDALKRSQQN
ncbi:MAG: hypothetical protein JSR58_01180 [Verrucomicrobia bacterium]|nr:hypothetical protein [Verrucomicrobiota bacterium]